MADIPYSELNGAIPGADPILDAAATARDFVCDIYQMYPRGIIPSLGSPVGQLTDAFARRLCQPTGKVPAPAEVPFNGGQCPVYYNVTFSYQSQEFPSGGGGTVRLRGPIGAPVERTEQDGSRTAFWVTFTHADGTFQIIGNGTKPGYGRIDSVVREDGLPDNCGSNPPQYPDVPIPPNAYDGNRDIPVGGNPINVPIALIPVVFAPVNVFKPEFDVELGPFNFNFNLGGIDLGPTFNLPSPTPLPPVDPRPIPPAPREPDGDGNNEGIDLSELNRKLDELLNCDRCEVDYVTQQTAYTTAPGRAINLPARTIRVDLDVSPIGPGVDVQYGDGGPNVLLAGWYAFGTSGGWSDRRPVSYQQNTFYPPEGANQFSYTVKRGCSATLLVVYEVED